jgi:hypothetical protein
MDDVISWGLNHNKQFSTKYVYKWLEKDLAAANNKRNSKSKLPLKIIFFLWQAQQDAILTREKK